MAVVGLTQVSAAAMLRLLLERRVATGWKNSWGTCLLAAALVGLAAAGGARETAGQPAENPAPRTAARLPPRVTTAALPLAFEPHGGPHGTPTRFLSRGPGYRLCLSAPDAVVWLPGGTPGPARPPTGDPRAADLLFRMTLRGANPHATPSAVDRLPGVVHYLVGRNPANWRRNVPTFAKVKIAQVYPGIDLVYYGNQSRLEYDFIVAPGGDPRAIKLEFAGVDRLEIGAAGHLVLHRGPRQARFRKPIVYQVVDGLRREIPGDYLLVADRAGPARASRQRPPAPHPAISFQVAAYDPGLPLVIDPVLEFSAEIAGGVLDFASGIAVDADGNTYITGFTASPAYPATPGAYLEELPGGGSAFVSKLNSNGTAFVYSTFLGGTNSANQQGTAIVVDTNGNASVTGFTEADDFPVTGGAVQTVFGGGGRDAFVAKLNATGSDLVYSTFLGGSDPDAGLGIALGSNDHTYVYGTTSSTALPTTAGVLQPDYGGGTNDYFLAKLSPDGSGFDFLTYLGGAGTENPDFNVRNGIDTDDDDNVYVTGSSQSADFPVTATAFQTNLLGAADAIVAKINPAGTALVYGTFLGGTGPGLERGYDIAVDAAQTAYVTGSTPAADFPTTGDAVQTNLAGASDAFITRFTVDATGLLFSTYLGGSLADGGAGIAVDNADIAYVVGATESADLPVTADALRNTRDGPSDGFVAEVNTSPAAEVLRYCTYRGGPDADLPTDIVTRLGAVAEYYLTRQQALMTTEGFVVDKFSVPIVVVLACTLEPALATNTVGSAHTNTVTGTSNGVAQAGTTVSFEIISGPNAGTTGMGSTDAEGKAEFGYISNGVPGTDTIRASGTVGTNLFSGDAQKVWVYTEPAQCSLAPLIATNFVGAVHSNVVTVSRNGFLVPGVTVTFTVFDALSQVVTNGNEVTDSAGQATFGYSQDDDATHTIVATGSVGDSEFQCEATKVWLDVPADCSLAPQSATNFLGETHLVTMTVTTNGSPAQGVAIDFFITDSVNSNKTGMGVTDGNGQTTFSYSSSVPAEDRIVAVGTVGGSVVQCEARKVWEAEPVLPACTISPLNPTNASAGVQSFEVLLTTNTVPVPAQPIMFFVSAGPGTNQAGTFLTATDGVGTFGLTNSPGGFDVVHATGTVANIAFGCVTTNFYIGPPTCLLAPALATNLVGETHSVTVTVQRASLPVAGTSVLFTVLTGPHAGTNDTVLTDGTGRAVFTYTGTGAGTDEIHASGSESGFGHGCTATKVWVFPPTCTLAPALATNFVGLTHSLTVTVRRAGSPVAGTAVLFDVLAGPHAGTSEELLTDANGQAVFAYLGTAGGADEIRAVGSVDGFGYTCTAAQVWLDLPFCVLAPAVATNSVSTRHTAVLTLHRGGEPLAGVPVDFAVATGPNAGIQQQLATDADGQAMFQYDGNSQPGEDAIVASGEAGGEPFACAATKVWRTSHDLAITQLKVASRIGLSAKRPSLTKSFKVKIQNRGVHTETIPTLFQLERTVLLTVESLGGCPNATVLLSAKNANKLPLILPPLKTATVQFDVAFDCANDPQRSTKTDPDHEDYRVLAAVDHAGLDGQPDDHPADDICPRDPAGPDPIPDETITDQGCGRRKPDKSLGAPVLIDVYLK